jgi:translation initiation factor 2 beta subunit (eIF-2beta)/eIF-5
MKVVKFGNENLSFMTDDLCKQIMGRGFSAICELVEYTHFNPKHPENHNIYIANLKNKYIVYYDGDKWAVSNKDDIMEDIIYAKSDFLFNKFRELSPNMTQSDKDRFIKYMNEHDTDKTLDRLKNDINLQLYNNRHLPQKMRQYMEKYKKIADTTNIDDNVILTDIIKSLKDLDNSKLKNIRSVLNNII